MLRSEKILLSEFFIAGSLLAGSLVDIHRQNISDWTPIKVVSAAALFFEGSIGGVRRINLEEQETVEKLRKIDQNNT